MKIYLDPSFIRAHKKIIKKNPKLQTLIKTKIKLLKDNPNNSTLRLHKLKGKKIKEWSITIKANLRIIFIYTGEDIILTDIGSHDEVY